MGSNPTRSTTSSLTMSTRAMEQEQLLAALNMAWLANPELRLMQLLVNAINPAVRAPQVYYVADEQMLALLQSGEWRTSLREAEPRGEGE